jgi:uncharacterized protein YjgD (DUF1641 family)
VSKKNGSASKLQERLSDADTVENLLQILDKLEIAAFALNAADGFFKRGEEIADNVSDTIADAKLGSSMGAEDVREGLALLPELIKLGAVATDLMSNPEIRGLLELLKEPENARALRTLLENADLMAFGLEALKGFLGRSEEVMDNVSQGFNEARQAAEGLKDVAGHLPEMLEFMPVLAETTQQLRESGVFDKEPVQVVGKAGSAAAHAYKETILEDSTVSLFKLMTAMRDPNIKTAVSFAYHMAEDFGRQLNDRKKNVSARALDRT